MTEIVAALITGAASVAAVVISNLAANRKIAHKIETAQAVSDTKLEELTREVRAHNNFARRMPVVEEQIRELRQRLEELERQERGRIS